MANKQCINRLQKEYKAILREPVPGITTHPSLSNLLDWHYVLEGAPGTEFEGGCYHGVISFPQQYPFKPPSIKMVTPNGRFAVNTKLCLSMTDFHPESWNPMWSVATILTGLQSFMSDTAHTTGAISSTPEEKRRLAAESLAYNVRNPTFRKLFPEWVKRNEERQAASAAAAAAPAALDAAPTAAAAQQRQQQQGRHQGKGGQQGALGTAAGPQVQAAGGQQQAQGAQEQNEGRQWGTLVAGAVAVGATAVAVASLSLSSTTLGGST